MNAIIHPTDLTEEQWQYFQRLLPPLRRRGHKPADRRRILNDIRHLPWAGCAWRLAAQGFRLRQTLCVLGCHDFDLRHVGRGGYQLG
jgi:transposase